MTELYDSYDDLFEDLHVHTLYSKDSREIPEKYVELAISRRLSYLGFSDHIDLDPTDKDFGYYSYQQAYESFRSISDSYSDKVNLLFGLEVTYQNFLESEIKRSIENKPYDYLIGSVHRVEGYTVSGPHGTQFFDGKTEEEAYTVYFDELERMVEMRFFDIVGHFDVIKRYGVRFYGPFRAEKYMEKIQRILEKVIQSGMVLEINSSGYRHELKEPYPSYEILSAYRELGGTKLVLGSDAHSTKHLGAFMRKAVIEALKIYDFEVVCFRKREQFTLCRLSDVAKI